jgi:lysozyme family protein
VADFKTAFELVMRIEGGYANDPDDNGGETYKGISRKNFPGWPGWKTVDLIKSTHPKNLDAALEGSVLVQGLVLGFYKTIFWDCLNLDKITNQAIATELFDTSVNMGQGWGSLFLRQALNLNNNGGKDYPDISEEIKNIGPLTIKCCNEHKRPNELFKTLNILQGARYIDIIRNNPKQEKFFRSWLSRVTTEYK